jgi:limonene-1,2-epoxide hydrolase/ketosteroid isomerase-like protein
MNALPTPTAQAGVAELLRAIESRDLRAVGRSLSPTATWQNVPHSVAVGREQVVAFLSGILTWADEVRWDIVSASYGGRRAWLERVDRFRLDGEWFDVRCNGVFEVDADGLVTEVRDYVDLGEWRDRVRPVLDRLTARAPVDVVERHLDAVRAGDVVSMAADYAIDAVLVRGHDTFDGWSAIADYFEGVPARLGGRTVSFDAVTITATGDIETRWTIAGGAAGVDTFRVVEGRIVHQTVALLGADF